MPRATHNFRFQESKKDGHRFWCQGNTKPDMHFGAKGTKNEHRFWYQGSKKWTYILVSREQKTGHWFLCQGTNDRTLIFKLGNIRFSPRALLPSISASMSRAPSPVSTVMFPQMFLGMFLAMFPGAFSRTCPSDRRSCSFLFVRPVG